MAIDKACAKLFYPTQACNRQTHQCCVRLAEKVGSQVCLEFVDLRKSLSMHLSAADGKFSVKNTTEAVHKTSVSIWASNDLSEANFGCFSEAFEYCRGMDIASAAGLGQTHDNNDFGRGSMDMVRGKRSTAERDSEESTLQEIGLFHELGIKLTDSLIATAKRNTSNFRRTIIDALRLQAQAREEKLKAIRTKKTGRGTGGVD